MNNRFFMTDNIKEKNITITVREVTSADSGTYWCGAETKQQRSNKFFNRLSLTVQPAPPSSATPLTTTTTTTAESHGVTVELETDVIFGITTAVIIGVAVFLIGFFLIYKRVSCTKNKGISASLQHVKEDSAYEEIQERLQTPGNAVDSIYVTAGMHTDVTSVHYSTINFQSHSREAGGEEVNPSTSACEYSTVDFRKRPDNSTITQASRPAEENLYSAVNELEQIRK
ncbi:CMRF35-like molecule 8 [Astatotilapia calliptera]|uniref:CMRF35-like molecule 8 n=1 Tax=Astatotilapia calliptera TaxID=8154 RepID=UPI000329FD53|nr:CMRF35-like molecule 8 [Maylandia zebra]XP_026022119.1 CMRF35-like molecule 8 [Astatotilapia calliptera]